MDPRDAAPLPEGLHHADAAEAGGVLAAAKLRERALSRWENEGGSPPPAPRDPGRRP